MGNYVSSEELEERVYSTNLDELAIVTGGNKEMLLNNTIDMAEAICDGYLSVLYVTPIPPSGLIKGIVLDLATYEMYKRSLGGDVPTKHKYARDEAIKLLEKISKAEIQPPRDANLQRVDTYGSTIDIISDTPMVTQRQRWGYDTDENGTEYDENYGSR